MSKITGWIKNNKLSTFLIVVVIFFIARSSLLNLNGARYMGVSSYDSFAPAGSLMVSKGTPSGGGGISNYGEVAPQPQVTDRKVITNSSISLLVKDVRATIDQIEQQVAIVKGYVVNTSITRPEEGANGYVVIRVPNTEMKSFLAYLRGLSVKVVSENISGKDITDQYMDIQARLDILNRNKNTYLAFMDKATTIDEILRVQQQIFNLQDQIDSLQGQIKYMDAASSTSLISVNLSTDELALPYAPDNAWRPQLVFKQAVRSLVGTLRIAGNAAIWIAVYAVILAPIVIVFFIVKKALKKRALKS
jgi:hypothetical protein